METTLTWELLPTEIRCMILSFLSPEELCPASLVNSRFREDASSDAVWMVLCARHFPANHKLENVDTFYNESVILEADKDEQHLIVKKEPSFPSTCSWKERYRYLSKNLFVIHHKYNAINTGALADALSKWEQCGATVIDLRASCNAFCDKFAENHMADMLQVLKRHRVAFMFTDGGMKENYRDPLGDALCDFVEAGNAVILGTFCTVATAEMPGGKWKLKNYNPILPDTQDSNIHFLGEKILPDHPILKDVNNISASWKATGESNPEATVLAFYDSGCVLAAEIEVRNGNKHGLVIALNLYLPSSDSPLNGWSNEPGNDVMKLLSNTFRYAMNYVCRRNQY